MSEQTEVKIALSEAPEHWRSLVNTATLGLDRAGAWTSVVDGSMLAPSAQKDHGGTGPAGVYLEDLSIIGAIAQAGRVESLAGYEPIEPADADEATCDDWQEKLLQEAISLDSAAALGEWVGLANQAGVHAPTSALIALLKLLAQEDVREKNAIATVLGKRGRWLANMSGVGGEALAQPDSTDSDFETATPEARLAILQALRKGDPARARILISSALPRESADQRARFIATLGEGLSMEDEDLLERCLDDRSKQVVAAATPLLSQLAESRYASRMRDRMKTTVTRSKRSLDANVGELDPAAKRDGLEAKAAEGLGQKAMILRRIAALTPLKTWIDLGLAKSADDAIDAALAGEWAAALCLGWLEAAGTQRDSAWSAALLSRWIVRADKLTRAIDAHVSLDRLLDLLGFVPATDVEAIARGILSKENTHQIAPALRHVPGPWSRGLGMAILDWLRARVAEPNAVYDTTIRQFMTTIAAARLDVSLAAPAQAGWPYDREHFRGTLEEAVTQMCRILTLRAQIQAAFAKKS